MATNLINKSISQQNIIDEFNLNFNLIADNEHFGILITSTLDKVIFANNTFLKNTEYNFSELANFNINDYIEKNSTQNKFTVNFLSKNDKPLSFIVTSNAIYNNGKISSILYIFIDVSINSNTQENELIEHNFTDFLSQTTILTDLNLEIQKIEKYGLNFLNIKEKNLKPKANIFKFIDEIHKKDIDAYLSSNNNTFKDILRVSVFEKQHIDVYTVITKIAKNNKTSGYRVTFTDLSQFKELKQKFDRSEQQYKTIFQNSQSALLLFDFEKGNIFEANLTALKLMNKELNEVINLNINNIITTASNDSFFDIIKENKPTKNKLFYVGKVPVEIGISTIEFYSQKYYQLSIFDYSKVVANQEKENLVKSNLKFLSNSATAFLKMSTTDNIYSYIGKSLLKIVPNSYILTASYNGTNVVVESLNGIISNAKEVLDSFPHKLIGQKIDIRNFRFEKNIKGLVNLDDYQIDKNFGEFSEYFHNTIRQKFSIKHHYSLLLTSNQEILGSISLFLKDEIPMFDKELVETFGNQAAIAIQKINLEKKLIIEKENAQDSDKLKTAFLANISHEIRTPMNSIIGFSEMLSKSNITNEQRNKYYNYIDNSGKTLLNLIDDIIDITKIEAGEINLTKNVFFPYEVISELFELFKRNFKNSNILFKINVNENIREIEIFTDKNRLNQIISNLLTNAQKFTAKGKVEFGYTINNNFIDFFVSDTGQGIPKKLQQSVFERFNRGNETLIQGTGLGLSISKHLVELMNGTFKLTSEENKGSTFSFKLPIEKPTVKNQIIKEKELDTNWKNKKILIVDDEELNLELLKEMLLETNATIYSATNGKEALELCKNTTFDLILMDIKMPVMDGFTATSLILEHNNKQKIIAQTAYAMSCEKEKAIKLGCIDFITKPIRRYILMNKISKIFSENTKMLY